WPGGRPGGATRRSAERGDPTRLRPSGVVDAITGGGHRLEAGLGDLLAARLALAVLTPVDLGQRPLDVTQLVAQRRHEHAVLALLGRHLARIGEVLVERHGGVTRA